MSTNDYTAVTTEAQQALFDMEIDAAMAVERFVTEQVADLKVSVTIESGETWYWLSVPGEATYSNSREEAARMIVNALFLN